MAVRSKSFPQDVASERCVKRIKLRKAESEKGTSNAPSLAAVMVWLQVAVGYALIELVLWTPRGRAQSAAMLMATVCILLFTGFGHYSARELGLRLPSLKGAAWILTSGLIAASGILAGASLLGENFPANTTWPTLNGAWQYAIWGVVQQFILQSFFYARLESVLGSSRAVLATAFLFSAAHIPSPVLTVATLLGALFFCEMFRRYRSIYPLGIVHAMLGLAMAASFPDSLLRHMRVGLGYLHFH
jgi:membrane protease YdiL (CAAX protease family)